MSVRLQLLVAVLLTSLPLGACEPLQPGPIFGPFKDCFQSRELAANVQNLAFTFDSQGVGHFAFNKDSQVHLGSSRPDDGLTVASGLVGEVVDIAIDGKGRRHLGLVHGSMSIYARENNGAWTQFELASDSRPLQLRLDPGGDVHMLLKLTGGTYPRIAYATNRSGVWQLEELRLIPGNTRVDMEIDARGNAHLAYYDSQRFYRQDQGIYYVTNASGDWVYEQVDASWSTSPVIAPDSEGTPHLLYSKRLGVYAALHATKQQGQWIYIDLPNGGVPFDAVHDLKVDATGALHALLSREFGTWLTYAHVPPEEEDRDLSFITPFPNEENIAPPYVLGLNAANSVHIGYLHITLNSSGSMMSNYVAFAQPCP